MECNKDEAIRAKQLAEKKLTEEDISAAKRFALKAQNLFPGLEGLLQFQETLDVYVSCQKKVNGEVDWYEVLGVDPLADDETIKKKYRKLALALHPDKNKSVGADGAFKIISEAWRLLSDKTKRDAYNKRRNVRITYQTARVVNPTSGPGKSTSKNFTHSPSKPRNPTAQEKPQQGVKASYKKGKGKTSTNNAGKSRYNRSTNSSSSTTSPATQHKPQQEARTSYQKAAHQGTQAGNGKNRHNTFSNGTENLRTVPSSPSGVNNSKTFWTSCRECKMQYEYVHIYRNKMLLCPTCKTSFKAREMPPPYSMGKRSSTKVPCGQQDTRTSYQNTPASRHNSFSNGASSTRNVATAKMSRTAPVPWGVNRNKTFWTSCNSCKMHYEYVYIYRNKKLLCSTCQKPFIAIEMPLPHSMGKRSSAKVPNSSASRPVTSDGQPEQDFQSTNNVNMKRKHEQEVDAAENERMFCKKRTVPVNPGSDIEPNLTKQPEMMAA